MADIQFSSIHCLISKRIREKRAIPQMADWTRQPAKNYPAALDAAATRAAAQTGRVAARFRTPLSTIARYAGCDRVNAQSGRAHLDRSTGYWNERHGISNAARAGRETAWRSCRHAGYGTDP